MIGELLSLFLLIYSLGLGVIAFLFWTDKIELSTVIISSVFLDVLFFGSVFIAAEERIDDLDSFCLSEGFYTSNRGSKSFCVQIDDGFVIEHEVKLVKSNWFFVKDGVGE